MPTLREAIATVDAKSVAGEIPNRVTGEVGALAASRRGPILTNVTAALRHALRGFDEHLLTNADDLLDVEIAPFLATLPDHAELDAREALRSDPLKERSNVALFVTIVTGRDAVREKKPIDKTRVLPSWEPLYNALWDLGQRDMKKRMYPRMLVRFSELALANGVVSPHAVPDDYNAVHAWASALGYKKKQVHEALSAFRCAADLLGDATLARAYDVVFVDGIGIRGLPDYVQRAHAAGLVGNPMKWSLLELISALAPDIGAALGVIVIDGRKRNCTPAYEKEIMHCGSWIVASLIRLGEDPRPLTLLDMFLDRREVVVERTADAEEGRTVKLGQLAKYTSAVSSHHTSTEQQSLLRRCLDVSAATSFANSHLQLANLVHEEDVIPVYTESLIANVQQAFLLTKGMFGAALEETEPALWGRVRNEYDTLRKHIKGYNAGRYLKGRKETDKLLITWPQAVCMGLPYLRKKAIAARLEAADRADRIGHLESRESQKRVLAYYEALRDYVVVAILLDDSLRISNYAGAIAGVHVIPVPDVHKGHWCGFRSARTHFKGADDPGVKLKVLARKDTNLNERERALTRSIVDMDLLFDWWTKARPFYLAQAGLLASATTYDPTNDGFAVFPTGRPSQEQRDDSTWKGNISADMLSEIFGRALHEICVVVLGHALPAWDDPALTDEYRSLFAGHIARTLVASYFGGILGDWSDAEFRTNDCEATLRTHYNRVASWFKQNRHKRSPDGPRWFDDVIGRVLEDRDDDTWGVFWDRFDPRQPIASLAMLDRAADPTTKRRAPPKRVA